MIVQLSWEKFVYEKPRAKLLIKELFRVKNTLKSLKKLALIINREINFIPKIRKQ